MKVNWKQMQVDWRMILGVTVLAVSFFVSGDLYAQPGVGPKSYKVITRTDGYVLQFTPKLKNFPSGATLEITLDDPARGKTTVRGTASKLSDTSFKIKTNQKFSFQPSSDTHVLMRRAGGPRIKVSKVPSWCKGCPRDANLFCEDPNQGCTMCYCW